MKDFSRDMVQRISQTKDSLIVKTYDLLSTLKHMQECGWKLQELIPDDEEGVECNILVYKKVLTPNQL